MGQWIMITKKSTLMILLNFLAFSFVDQPKDVRLTTNASSKVCTGVVINFSCTAEANPRVHTYLLFENDIAIKNLGIPGTWQKSMENAGHFVFRCEANNFIQGIGRSGDTILTVDGEFKYIHSTMLLF